MLLHPRSKDRPYHLGLFPLETLARDDSIAEREAARPPRPLAETASGSDGLLADAARHYRQLFVKYADGPVAPQQAPVPNELARRSIDIKGAAYFLDASQVGICEIPRSAWLAGAEPPQYVAVQAFVDPAREAELRPLVARGHETGCVVTTGLGPRFLHSTGQLHKGGPDTGLFVQVVDELGKELPIPGRDFGFGRLIRAQAAGDLAALEERGRRVIRLRLEDLA